MVIRSQEQTLTRHANVRTWPGDSSILIAILRDLTIRDKLTERAQEILELLPIPCWLAKATGDIHFLNQA